MTSLDPDAQEQARKKRTLWLLAGGAASLLLPLLGVIYLHWSSATGGQGPTGRSDVFERREGADRRITPSQTAVPSAGYAVPPPSSLPTGGKTEQTAESSLDFVKPGQEMAGKPAAAAPPAAAPAAATATAAAKTAPPPAAPAPKTKAKKGKKEFAMPKLQPSRGFTSFGHSKAAAAPQAAPSGGGDAQDYIKNLPPDAANNPELQKYLQQQGK